MIRGKYIVIGGMFAMLGISAVFTWLSYKVEKLIHRTLECILVHAEASTNRAIKEENIRKHSPFLSVKELGFVTEDEGRFEELTEYVKKVGI